LGEAKVEKFAKKYPSSRSPLRRFLKNVREAEWPYYPAVTQSFPAADYVQSSGTLIFDIGGNKYRLVAHVDFVEQILYVESVLTHEQYDRENT
jgi:mRNA interferase HigB